MGPPGLSPEPSAEASSRLDADLSAAALAATVPGFQRVEDDGAFPDTDCIETHARAETPSGVIYELALYTAATADAGAARYAGLAQQAGVGCPEPRHP